MAAQARRRPPRPPTPLPAAGGEAPPGPFGAAYLAAEAYAPQLEGELRRQGIAVAHWHGRLALTREAPVPAAWSLDTWAAPVEAGIASIGAAADMLRAVQRNWALYAATHHRRATLIAARLPPVKAAPLAFPAPPPGAHLGAWTLLAPDRLLWSAAKSSPFVNGEVRFVEDREGPPSRAYLKLWEAMTRMGAWPGPGARCIDLGAAPGGWTWALARLGAEIVAVDRAPLDPRIAAMPGVTGRIGSAFAIAPEPRDWMVCDVAAYPDRLLRLAETWTAPGGARRIVATMKFQGETDFDAAAALAAIPGGTVRHLFHNKHELTLMWTRPGVCPGAE